MIIFGYWCDGMTPWDTSSHLQETRQTQSTSWLGQGLPSDRVSCENGAILCNSQRWSALVLLSLSSDDLRLHKFPMAVFVLNGETIDCGMDFHKSIWLCCKCLTLKVRPTDYWNYGANVAVTSCFTLILSPPAAISYIFLTMMLVWILESTMTSDWKWQKYAKTIYVPFISIFESFFSWNFSYHQTKQ